ncbi:MAG: hypothetical protein AAFQ88_07605 [Pseudomonadota bacterium]
MTLTVTVAAGVMTGEQDEALSEARVAALFTRSDGTYRFARWGRPLVPAVFGLPEVEERALIETVRAVASLGPGAAAEDPDMGANFLVFFCSDWTELRAVPGLPKLVPDLERLTAVLAAAGANQYRIFGFDPDRDPGREGQPGAIRVCITLLRLDDNLEALGPRGLALSQTVMGLLLWSDHAFTRESTVATFEGTERTLVKPWVQAVIRAAYSPGLPDAAEEEWHARQLARLAAGAL